MDVTGMGADTVGKVAAVAACAAPPDLAKTACGESAKATNANPMEVRIFFSFKGDDGVRLPFGRWLRHGRDL